jgi:hypothetical protein
MTRSKRATRDGGDSFFLLVGPQGCQVLLSDLSEGFDGLF